MYHFWYSATASYKFEQDKISTIGPSMVSWKNNFDSEIKRQQFAPILY